MTLVLVLIVAAVAWPSKDVCVRNKGYVLVGYPGIQHNTHIPARHHSPPAHRQPPTTRCPPPPHTTSLYYLLILHYTSVYSILRGMGTQTPRQAPPWPACSPAHHAGASTMKSYKKRLPRLRLSHNTGKTAALN
ncbi:hypothetical protein E2C01_005195 [Portunus trituberculatus]|uniref:Secreted protein n=1 Tax=Portunus trituberculatus TaxID=210409 RepID=A0A5B7CVZ5_PORTR|nr:hypothetical protein [Portunus trituberculatus]